MPHLRPCPVSARRVVVQDVAATVADPTRPRLSSTARTTTLLRMSVLNASYQLLRMTSSLKASAEPAGKDIKWETSGGRTSPLRASAEPAKELFFTPHGVMYSHYTTCTVAHVMVKLLSRHCSAGMTLDDCCSPGCLCRLPIVATQLLQDLPVL